MRVDEFLNLVWRFGSSPCIFFGSTWCPYGPVWKKRETPGPIFIFFEKHIQIVTQIWSEISYSKTRKKVTFCWPIENNFSESRRSPKFSLRVCSITVPLFWIYKVFLGCCVKEQSTSRTNFFNFWKKYSNSHANIVRSFLLKN